MNNKFIVWDKFHKNFIEDLYFDKAISINEALEENEDYSFHQYLLDDTTGNKIYVNCSIISFVYRPIGEIKTARDCGFIFFCEKDFMYKINILTKSDKNGNNFIFNLGSSLNKMYMKEIKVIDTIQENKLGLMK